MKISDISVPEIYKSSADFRFFLKWFELALERIKHDTENIMDLYDPLRCPEQLLWMLGDTVGYKYDSRLPASFNRLVLLYFMSMIRHKGSKDGVTLAAEVNLAQFNLLDYGKQSDILLNRLEDTAIPVNSVYVTPHTADGYIEVVYFSEKKPVDACLEYVRPLGMYIFDYAGVRYDGRTKISVDARLTNSNDAQELGMSIGPTRVGHYRREDYARMQKVTHTVKRDDLNEVTGSFEWQVDFAEMGGHWILATRPTVHENKISKSEAESRVTTEDADGFERKSQESCIWNIVNVGNHWVLEDSNSHKIGCTQDNSITPKATEWIFEPVKESPGQFTIYTVSDAHRLYLASNLVESGNFRGYLEDTIAQSPHSYSTAFSFYKFDEANQEYELIRHDDELTRGTYVIMTSSYALSVIADSGVIVGTQVATLHRTPLQDRDTHKNDLNHIRNKSYYRNSDYEQHKGADVDAGYRAIYSLQLCNNEHIVKSTLPTIFGLGYNPHKQPSGSLPPAVQVTTHESTPVTRRLTSKDLFDRLPWNLAYDKHVDEAHTLKRTSGDGTVTYDVSTARGGQAEAPVPAVNPPMQSLGDAISLGESSDPKQVAPTGINKYYTETTIQFISDGTPRTTKVDVEDPKAD